MHLLKMAGVWFLGMVPGALYIVFNPDGIAHPDRWSTGPWLQALKYTPYTHAASFVFGVMLASLDEMVPRASRLRLWLGLIGFGGLFGLLELGPIIPYALIHDGLLMPLFGCMILGLAGENPLSFLFGLRPLVFVGEASYCLYLLHFTLGPAAPEPVRPVDQLLDPDWPGAVGAAPGGEAGTATTAEVDGGVRNADDRLQMKRPAASGWAFCRLESCCYGVTDWVEWLPCGTDANAVGASPVG
jgi:hypothetical protein